MAFEKTTYPAHPVQKRIDHYLQEIILVIILGLISLPLWFGLEVPLFYFLMLGTFLIYILYRFLRPAKENFQYELASDRLIIHTFFDQKEIPYRDIRSWTVSTVYENPSPYENGQNRQGLLYGKWKWRHYVATFYATRRDRLLLLDTVDGLVAITPAADIETPFTEQLQAKSNLAPEQAIPFEPQHAARAVPQWPPVLLFGAFIPAIFDLAEDMTPLELPVIGELPSDITFFAILFLVYAALWKLIFRLNRTRWGRWLILGLTAFIWLGYPILNKMLS